MSEVPTPNLHQPRMPSMSDILRTTCAVGQVSQQTRDKVAEVIDFLTMEPDTDRPDPIEELKMTLDFVLGRLSALEDQTARILAIVEKPAHSDAWPMRKG